MLTPYTYTAPWTSTPLSFSPSLQPLLLFPLPIGFHSVGLFRVDLAFPLFLGFCLGHPHNPEWIALRPEAPVLLELCSVIFPANGRPRLILLVLIKQAGLYPFPLVSSNFVLARLPISSFPSTGAIHSFLFSSVVSVVGGLSSPSFFPYITTYLFYSILAGTLSLRAPT